MDVTTRNFFRLLRAGAFAEQVTIEPLSAWKWNKLYQLSLMHGMAAIIHDGIVACQDQFFMQLPEQLASTWQNTVSEIEGSNRETNMWLSDLIGQLNKVQVRPIVVKGQATATLYDQPLHRTTGDIDIFYPYETQAKKADKWVSEHAEEVDTSDKGIVRYQWHGIKAENHRRLQRLSNTLHNHTLQGIIRDEFSSNDAFYVLINSSRVETVPPTLNLLLMLIRITRYIMNDGISLKQITDLGIFLRKDGDKVDYVKLQGWIERLGLTQFAQLEGAMLVKLMNFTEDEIPFMQAGGSERIDKIMEELFVLHNDQFDEWHFEQGKGVFVHASNMPAMLWHVKQSAKYFRYYPSESLANLMTSFARSLSGIEE